MVWCLAQGHLDTQQGGAGDRTIILPATSKPALPPEPHSVPILTSLLLFFLLSTSIPNIPRLPHYNYSQLGVMCISCRKYFMHPKLSSVNT